MHPTLRIGVPVYESVPAPSFASFLGIAEAGPWTILRGTWIDKARNEIMDQFNEDYLLMLDADMVFQPHQAQQLVASLISHPECGAISGHYVSRCGSSFPVCDWHHKDIPGAWLSDEDRWKRAERHMAAKEVAYVDSFGGGFLAISQEVKKKVEPPWFKTEYQESGDYLGEDTYFCKKLQEAGFKPAVNFKITVGHCGQTIYRPELGQQRSKQ